MRPKEIMVGLTPADANGICAAQTTAGAAELDLSNGELSAVSGVARMGTATQLLITCAADESARMITIEGVASNGFAISEKVAGANATTTTSSLSYREVSRVEIDGAASGNISVGISGDANAIALAQQPSAASALTLAGIFTYEAKMFGIAENGNAAAVKIESAGNDSGVTFTVYGRDADNVDISEAITGANAGTATGSKLFKQVFAVYASGATAAAAYVGWAADTDGIAESQTLSGAGYFVMNGARCGLQARHVSITSAGSDESGVTFTVVGLDRRGDRITEEITGPTASATVKGDKNFQLVQAIYVDGALTGNVTVGSADECEGPTVPVDYYIDGISVAIHHDSNADLTHSFLTTLDNVLAGERNEDNARWVEEIGSSTADETLSSQSVVKAVRLEVTSHTRGIIDLLLSFPGSVGT